MYLVSYTADVDKSYSWLAKEYIIHPKNMDKTIQLILQIQKLPNRKNICIAFDDFDISSQSDSLDLLYTRGRHYGITTILSCQITTKSISPAIRNNTIYLFFRKLNSKTIKDNIFNMLLNTEFENGKDLNDFTNEHIEDYQFILYLNDDRPARDAIKIVKAEDKDFEIEYIKSKKPEENPKRR
jgi:hypothetical protein